MIFLFQVYDFPMKFQSHLLLIYLDFYVCIYGVIGEEEMLHVSPEERRTILGASELQKAGGPLVMGAGNWRAAGSLTAQLYLNTIYLFFLLNVTFDNFIAVYNIFWLFCPHTLIPLFIFPSFKPMVKLNE